MKLARVGQVVVALGVTLLWVVVGGGVDATGAVACVAVAGAVGAWAPLANL